MSTMSSVGTNRVSPTGGRLQFGRSGRALVCGLAGSCATGGRSGGGGGGGDEGGGPGSPKCWLAMIAPMTATTTPPTTYQIRLLLDRCGAGPGVFGGATQLKVH